MNDSDLLELIIKQLMEYANDASKEYQENPSEFNSGRCVGYYECLDTIKNRLMIYEKDLGQYGLDILLEDMFK